jgi:glycine cleavage system H protein
VLIEGDEAVVGITEWAQGELGDVVFVELPELESEVAYMQPFGTIEAVKAASDLYSPVTGVVIDVNQALADNPALVNSSPYDEGWMIRVRVTDKRSLSDLLEPTKYRELIGE